MPDDQHPQDSSEGMSPWSNPAPRAESSTPQDQPAQAQPPTDPYASPQPGAAPYGQQPYAPPPTPYGQPPTGVPPYPQQQPYGQQPYGQQPYQQPGYQQPASSATTVMILGIVSVVLLFTCGLGFIPAIIALVKAPNAKREIEMSNGQLSGLGQVTAGRITSWVTIGLTIVGVVVAVILVIVFASFGNDYDYSSPSSAV